MPHGKPAGMPCIQLDEHYRCRLWGKPDRPPICISFRAQHDMCGDSREDALATLEALELASRP